MEKIHKITFTYTYKVISQEVDAMHQMIIFARTRRSLPLIQKIIQVDTLKQERHTRIMRPHASSIQIGLTLNGGKAGTIHCLVRLLPWRRAFSGSLSVGLTMRLLARCSSCLSSCWLIRRALTWSGGTVDKNVRKNYKKRRRSTLK